MAGEGRKRGLELILMAEEPSTVLDGLFAEGKLWVMAWSFCFLRMHQFAAPIPEITIFNILVDLIFLMIIFSLFSIINS